MKVELSRGKPVEVALPFHSEEQLLQGALSNHDQFIRIIFKLSKQKKKIVMASWVDWGGISNKAHFDSHLGNYTTQCSQEWVFNVSLSHTCLSPYLSTFSWEAR